MLQEDEVAAALLAAKDVTTFQRFSPRLVRGDGNCLYRAISLALYGTEESFACVRFKAAVQMIENRRYYDNETSDFIIHDSRILTPAYKEILPSVLTDGSYAELIHIFAISAAYQIPLQSYCVPGI